MSYAEIADLIIPGGMLFGGLIGLAVTRQEFSEPPGYLVVRVSDDRPRALDTRAAATPVAPVSAAPPVTAVPRRGDRGPIVAPARIHPTGQARHAVGTPPPSGVPTASSPRSS